MPILNPGQQVSMPAGTISLDFQLLNGAINGAYTIRYFYLGGGHRDKQYILPEDGYNYNIDHLRSFEVINTGKTSFNFM